MTSLTAHTAILTFLPSLLLLILCLSLIYILLFCPIRSFSLCPCFCRYVSFPSYSYSLLCSSSSIALSILLLFIFSSFSSTLIPLMYSYCFPCSFSLLSPNLFPHRILFRCLLLLSFLFFLFIFDIISTSYHSILSSLIRHYLITII